MLTLVSSKQPLLELRGARGLGRIAYKAPFYCPTPNKVVTQTKTEIAQAGGITALIGLLLASLSPSMAASLNIMQIWHCVGPTQYVRLTLHQSV